VPKGPDTPANTVPSEEKGCAARRLSLEDRNWGIDPVPLGLHQVVFEEFNVGSNKADTSGRGDVVVGQLHSEGDCALVRRPHRADERRQLALIPRVTRGFSDALEELERKVD